MTWADDHPFESWPFLTLPVWTAKKNLALTSVDLVCDWCGEKLDQAWLRGKVHDWGNNLECFAGARCPWCGHITYSRFRFYGDYADFWTPRGWVTKERTLSWREKVRAFFAGLGLIGGSDA
jgi:hypothetical protein